MKKETALNKIFSLAILLTAIIVTVIGEGDGLFLIFSLMICIPLFFSKKNWICIEITDSQE